MPGVIGYWLRSHQSVARDAAAVAAADEARASASVKTRMRARQSMGFPGPDQTPSATPAASAPQRSRSQPFLAGPYWLILRNVIGWVLILLAVAVTPLPGPGGVPLFLIGFALIWFPGKRRLTARVLRGKPVRFRQRPFAVISFGVALAVAAVALPLVRSRVRIVAASYEKGPVAQAMLYGIAVAAIWLLARATPHVLNLLMRLIARARHRVRPWLRHRGIRLLPPRWRPRFAHEPGVGPFRIRDEILKFRRRRRQ